MANAVLDLMRDGSNAILASQFVPLSSSTDLNGVVAGTGSVSGSISTTTSVAGEVLGAGATSGTLAGLPPLSGAQIDGSVSGAGQTGGAIDTATHTGGSVAGQGAASGSIATDPGEPIRVRISSPRVFSENVQSFSRSRTRCRRID